MKNKDAKGYASVAKHSEKQFDVLGRAGQVMSSVASDKAVSHTTTTSRPLRSSEPRPQVFSRDSGASASGDTTRPPWEKKPSALTLTPQTNLVPAKRKFWGGHSTSEEKYINDNAVVYCPHCHDFDECKIVWVKTSDDGRWARKHLGEECDKCGYVLKNSDGHFSLCFRCHCLLCRWCSKEQWLDNGRRLVVNQQKRQDTVLPDGPLSYVNNQEMTTRDGSCPYQRKGMCLAGRFCGFEHRGHRD